MAIEEMIGLNIFNIINYGVMGIWVAYLLWEKHKILLKMQKKLEKLTDPQ